MFYASVGAHTCLHDATFPAAKLQMTSSSHRRLPSLELWCLSLYVTLNASTSGQQ
jgi:hypothetical protein